ncbi:cell division protein FtsQ/DivIB [Chlamydiota bacterium]
MGLFKKRKKQTKYNQSKRHGKKRLFSRFKHIFIFLSSITAGIFLFFTIQSILITDSFFAIKHIIILNNHFTTAKDISLASKIKKGENLFSVNLTKAKENVEKLYLVKEAILKRQLPNTISIKIIERYPIAKIIHKKHPYLVDEEGVVIFKNSPFKMSSLPEIISNNTIGLVLGQKISSHIICNALDSINIYNESQLKNLFILSKVLIKDPHTITFVTQDKTTITIGNEQFIDRFTKLLAIYKDNKKKDLRITSIDLRYNSVPITLRQLPKK